MARLFDILLVMETKYIYIIGGVLGIGIIGIILANVFAGPDAGGTEIRTTEQSGEIQRPAAQPRANTFGIMTPEEKAAAEEAARLAAEAAALASSTASTTASSTDDVLEGEGESEEEV